MNSLSIENLIDTPGTVPVRMVSGLGRPFTVEIDHGDAKMRFRHDVAGLGQPQTDDPDFGFNLSPNFAPWWKDMPLPKVVQSASTGAARTPPGGELLNTRTAYRESYPLTVSNDERNLPTPSGKPLLRLKGEKFTRVFPHTTIDYSDLRPQVFPDIGPTPPGWVSPPRYGQEEARAVNAIVGAPAAYPEDMTTDISGFGSLHEAFVGGYGMHDVPGIVVSLDDPPAKAATAAVTQQAAAAKAAGASPSEIEQIIAMGSQAAALYLQARAIQKMPAPAPLPVKPGPTLASTLLAADEPFYKRPLFIGGVAVLLGVAGYAAFKGGNGGSRRGTGRRYRR